VHLESDLATLVDYLAATEEGEAGVIRFHGSCQFWPSLADCRMREALSARLFLPAAASSGGMRFII
jgi:hypothetical protein